MTTLDEQSIRDFIFKQVALWNAGRKDDFMALYRTVAPAGLTLRAGIETCSFRDGALHAPFFH